MDINGDGLPDRVDHYDFETNDAGLWVSLNTGSGFSKKTKWRYSVKNQQCHPTWVDEDGNVLSTFMDMNGDMNSGAYFRYSAAGADQLNPLFVALNSSDAGAKVAYPDFIEDPSIPSFEPGDTRLNKVVARSNFPVQLELAGMAGAYDVWIYQSSTDPVGIIRNEELLLLYAEANMVSNPGEAEAAVDAVRAAAGLGVIGAGNVDEDQIIYERRYSLFAEGHRWIDMRRFDRLDEINQDYDRAGDVIPVQFPIPQNEGQ